MDLQAVAFPALIAADDGWVQYLSGAEDLSLWKTLRELSRAARHVHVPVFLVTVPLLF
jgi:hypothetical protein